MKKFSRFFIHSLVIVLLLSGVACKRAADALPSSVRGDDVRAVTDDTGRKINLPVELKRIVSLAPSLTETVYAVGAGDLLVGDTTYCDYPEAAKSVAKVGDTLNPNLERIVALKPELILITKDSQLEAFTRKLDEQNIAYFVIETKDVAGVLNSIAEIGALCNRKQRAAQVAAEIFGRIEEVEAVVANEKPVRVFYQLSAEPLYTAGRDAFVTDIVKRAGGASVTAEQPGAWLKFSAETAIALKPEAIVVPVDTAMNSNTNAQLAPALKQTPAAQNNRVIKINGDFLSRPGPRLIEGLEQLARALHPAAFAKQEAQTK